MSWLLLANQCKLEMQDTARKNLIPKLTSEHAAAGLLRHDRESYNFIDTDRDRADFQCPDELEPDVRKEKKEKKRKEKTTPFG